MKGRAVTDEQKQQIINRLYVAWCSVPSLRLGQLISNCTPEGKDIFYIEDEDLIAAIEAEEIEWNMWQNASNQDLLNFERKLEND